MRMVQDPESEKDPDEDARPEHAVISTFDLFSIGGACTVAARGVIARLAHDPSHIGV